MSLIEYPSTVPQGQDDAAPAYRLAGTQQQKDAVNRGQDRSPSYARDDWAERLWLWEALSITVAALALAAIVITLVLHENRPLPKWPSAITINALISVFTAILKSSLMMPIAEGISQLKWLWYLGSRPLGQMEQWDLASRGPWGSVLLIFMLKSQDIAVIGALLTIVAMAVDPFTQNIVQYHSCPIVAEGERAMVPYSNNYTAGFWGKPTNSPHVVVVTKTPDPDTKMQSAVYAGLLDPPANVSAVLNFECRTGNCTFPSTDDGAAFLSLALQSRCADIRSDISFTESVWSVTYTDFQNSTYTYTTPNASLSDYGISLAEFGPTQDNVMQSGNQGPQGWPSHFLNKVSFLMSSRDGTAWTQSISAFECEFYPSVDTYSANITNGVLLEQVLDSQRMEVWPVALGTHSLLLINRTIRGGEWHECTSGSEPSDEHNFPIIGWPSYKGLNIGTSFPLDQLINRSGDAWNQTEWWPQDCVYWIPYAPTVGLSGSIHSLVGNESLYFDRVIERAKGTPWSVNLWNEGNATLETVQAAMDGLARSITARWRQGDGISDNVGPVTGMVWENQTCVLVNWAWISLPAALLLLTIVFLILTVLRTNSKGARVWKSSMLAVLFNGLDLKTRQDAGAAVSLEEMRAAADTAKVRLVETKNGLRLVGQS